MFNQNKKVGDERHFYKEREKREIDFFFFFCKKENINYDKKIRKGTRCHRCVNRLGKRIKMEMSCVNRLGKRIRAKKGMVFREIIEKERDKRRRDGWRGGKKSELEEDEVRERNKDRDDISYFI